MNDRRRPRTPAKPKPSPQLTGPVQLDDETRNALILFNARLVAQEELEREKRRVDKATKAKDEAAANVRKIETDPKATAEQKSEAQAAYRAALDALDRAKAGEPPAAGDATETYSDTDETADTATDDTATEQSDTATDDTATEQSAAATDDTATEQSAAATDEPATEQSAAATDEPATDDESQPSA